MSQKVNIHADIDTQLMLLVKKDDREAFARLYIRKQLKILLKQ